MSTLMVNQELTLTVLPEHSTQGAVCFTNMEQIDMPLPIRSMFVVNSVYEEMGEPTTIKVAITKVE